LSKLKKRPFFGGSRRGRECPLSAYSVEKLFFHRLRPKFAALAISSFSAELTRSFPLTLNPCLNLAAPIKARVHRIPRKFRAHKH
jgi:hypothetical protein